MTFKFFFQDQVDFETFFYVYSISMKNLTKFSVKTKN